MNRRRQRNLPVLPHKHVRRANRDAWLLARMPAFIDDMGRLALASAELRRLLREMAAAGRAIAVPMMDSEIIELPRRRSRGLAGERLKAPPLRVVENPDDWVYTYQVAKTTEE